MAENSKIEWTDHTFNPWRGCTKVSPGCLNCYAETLSKRNPAVLGQWGSGKPRVLASDSMWSQPLKWNREAAAKRHETEWSSDDNPRGLRPPRVFCASLADWLDDEVPVVWLARLLVLIMRTPELDWLLLTKRPQNFRGRMNAALKCVLKATGGEPCNEADFIDGWVNKGDAIPKNIWIGTTVEDQQRANERIPHLLKIPAKIRFLSCEPMLAHVDLESVPLGETCDCCHTPVHLHALTGFTGCHGDCDGPTMGKIHWVICGGESGPNARPMNPDWARSLRDQCNAAGVSFFFKQWGEFVRDAEIHAKAPAADSVTVPFGDGDPTNYRRVYRVGKKLAGRLLDGREWNELPSMKGGTAQHG